MKKIKTYRMPISRVFPVTHPRAGEETYFYYMIKNAVDGLIGFSCYDRKGDELFVSQKKLHTVRSNYPIWKKRVDEVNAGNAVLVLYEWTGKPRKSKTRELFRFDKDSGIGVQELVFHGIDNPRISRHAGFHGNSTIVSDLHSVSRNDGLSKQDFIDWFKGCKLSEPMAIIHFTNFRY